jgi:hypothetical protein
VLKALFGKLNLNEKCKNNYILSIPGNLEIILKAGCVKLFAYRNLARAPSPSSPPPLPPPLPSPPRDGGNISADEPPSLFKLVS